jgi:hypothetical protein
MSFTTGIIPFNGSNTNAGPGTSIDWQALVTAWQIQDCSGNNVGDPVQGLQAVIINKVQAAICNPTDIIGTYNIPARTVLTDGQTITILKNLAHSIAFKVISGDGTIKIGDNDAQIIEAGEADAWTASRVLNRNFVFVCNTGKIVITAMGDAGSFEDSFSDEFSI